MTDTPYTQTPFFAHYWNYTHSPEYLRRKRRRKRLAAAQAAADAAARPPAIVAQVSKPAVSRVSKPAAYANSTPQPIPNPPAPAAPAQLPARLTPAKPQTPSQSHPPKGANTHQFENRKSKIKNRTLPSPRGPLPLHQSTRPPGHQSIPLFGAPPETVPRKKAKTSDAS